MMNKKSWISLVAMSAFILTVQAGALYENQQDHSEARPDPKNVIDNYIKAVGGMVKIAKVENATRVMEAEFQGAKIVIKSIADQKNKRLLQETSVMGNVAQKTVLVNGKGKMIAMGQEQELNEEMVQLLSLQAYVFPEAHYEELGFELNMLEDESVNGEQAYVIGITATSGVFTKEYYSINTGLKLRTSSDATGEISYGDYQQVEGILIPKSMSIKNPMLPVALEAKVVSLVFNKTLTDEDFK
jgi:hypothetical protein